MKILTALPPYLLSWFMGFMITQYVFRQAQRPAWPVRLFLAGGLGAGISAGLQFMSFWLLDGRHNALTVMAHLLLGTLLAYLLWQYKPRRQHKIRRTETNWKQAAASLVFILACLPLWFQSQYYPLGGWDAWQVWNFKARFLFLAGNHWKNLFHPVLWRSSPHYPLLLPLFNVWAWSFFNHPAVLVPQLTALFFTVLTMALLSTVLWESVQKPWVMLGPILLLTLPFYGLLAISQYSDIALSFYFLAGFFCLCETLRAEKRSGPSRQPPGRLTYAALGGIFWGMAGFTKPEGLVAAGIACLMTGILWLTSDYPKAVKIKLFLSLALALGIISIPSIVFHLKYSPGNLTFVNGLASTQQPVTLYRLKMILAFLLTELKSSKWNGLWFLLGFGIILGGRRCWRRDQVILPAFLLLYLTAVLGYCWINTYFPIGWWLQVSLNRILFSLLPIMVFWVFGAIGQEK